MASSHGGALADVLSSAEVTSVLSRSSSSNSIECCLDTILGAPSAPAARIDLGSPVVDIEHMLQRLFEEAGGGAESEEVAVAAADVAGTVAPWSTRSSLFARPLYEYGTASPRASAAPGGGRQEPQRRPPIVWGAGAGGIGDVQSEAFSPSAAPRVAVPASGTSFSGAELAERRLQFSGRSHPSCGLEIGRSALTRAGAASDAQRPTRSAGRRRGSVAASDAGRTTSVIGAAETLLGDRHSFATTRRHSHAEAVTTSQVEAALDAALNSGTSMTDIASITASASVSEISIDAGSLPSGHRGLDERSSAVPGQGRLWSPSSSAFTASVLSDWSPSRRRNAGTSEDAIDSSVSNVLRRLTADALLEESASASVRRALRMGVVMSGHRLSDEEIRRLPKVRFEAEEQQHCSICLEAYRQGQVLTALQCNHFFHVDCLASWMERATQCPLCRQECGRRDVSESRESRDVLDEPMYNQGSSGFSVVSDAASADSVAYVYRQDHDDGNRTDTESWIASSVGE